jgi:hypothetical protein
MAADLDTDLLSLNNTILDLRLTNTKPACQGPKRGNRIVVVSILKFLL